MSKFQIILTAIFVLCIIAGVALFATYKSKNESNTLPTITVWGTFPKSVFSTFIQELNSSRTVSINIDYVEKSPSNFNKDFIETLARGKGPDAVLLPLDMLAKHSDKVIPIPYSFFSERDFKNTYITEAELYLSSNGIYAIPFTVDPLVMYWNRDLFANAGIPQYPRFWDEFSKLIKIISQKDINSNIRRTAIALGEFDNITHIREILSTLMMQAGNPITIREEGGIKSVLSDGKYADSSSQAIDFFTKFSNPRSEDYSWNRSLPSSKNYFLSGSLATYFGFASELFDIRNKNPNIDFDVASIPQARNAKNRVSYGNMYGFSIIRTATNQGATYTILQSITSPEALSILTKLTYLPPIRRDMLSTGSTDPYLSIFYDSALISRSWLDPNVNTSNSIFKELVESVTSGRSDTRNALKTAHEELEQSINSQ